MDDLVIRVRGLEAFDARDKVFGVLGMHTPGTRPDIVLRLIAPDYNRSLQHVLRHAVLYSILDAKHENLWPLKQVSHWSDVDLHVGGCPSWIPRFDRAFNRQVRIHLTSISIYALHTY